MKSIIMSFQPKVCESIVNGVKTIELRKQRPEISTPFRSYLYCVPGPISTALVIRDSYAKLVHCANHKTAIAIGGKIVNGKVIGEFICDDIQKYSAEFTDDFAYEDIRRYEIDEDGEEQDMIITANDEEDPDDCAFLQKVHMSFKDVKRYVGTSFHDKPFYGFHIADLKIYDKPRELCEFHKELPKHRCSGCEKCEIVKSPKSWCYVKE